MKNLIISILATIIFYTQFCEIKMQLLMPVIVLILFAFIEETESVFKEYRRKITRAKRLQRKIRGII